MSSPNLKMVRRFHRMVFEKSKIISCLSNHSISFIENSQIVSQVGTATPFNESLDQPSQTSSYSIPIDNVMDETTSCCFSQNENENWDDGFQVTLEVAKNQRRRNEKRKRNVNDSHSKPLKITKTDIKIEPNDELFQEHQQSNKFGQEQPYMPVEIDQVKQEVLESDIPIVNLPVTETSEMDQYDESYLSLTPIYENAFDDHLTENYFDNPDFFEITGKINK